MPKRREGESAARAVISVSQPLKPSWDVHSFGLLAWRMDSVKVETIAGQQITVVTARLPQVEIVSHDDALLRDAPQSIELVLSLPSGILQVITGGGKGWKGAGLQFVDRTEAHMQYEPTPTFYYIATFHYVEQGRAKVVLDAERGALVIECVPSVVHLCIRHAAGGKSETIDAILLAKLEETNISALTKGKLVRIFLHEWLIDEARKVLG